MSTTLITGPMFSGKSTELLRYLERAVRGNKKVCLIRPMIDDREFFSHSNGTQTIFDSLSITTYIFSDIYENNYKSFTQILKEYDVIGIDECQFIPALVYYLIDLIKHNKTTYLSGLLATSENEVFKPIKEILPYCDTIEKLNGVCSKCGSELGNYTFYKEGKKTKNIEVGGNDKYTVLCGNCLMGT